MVLSDEPLGRTFENFLTVSGVPVSVAFSYLGTFGREVSILGLFLASSLSLRAFIITHTVV